MTIINPNSISGISSITALNSTAAINLFKADGTSANIIAGVTTGSNFITGTSNVGVNTNDIPASITGVGNSFQGMYVSNGMIIYDNELNGNHYIGTNFNGLMAGPVVVNGSLTVDGHYVVV